jgi:pyruvate dehydrogenase (quinone)
VADRLGAGIAAALLGKPVLDNSLPHHTGVMGHLGSTASDRLMSGCDGLLIVGSNEPYTEFLPQPGQARAVQIDISGGNIGTRYPTEVNVVGDARETLRLLAPRLRERDDGSWRAQVEESVREWHMILDRRALAPAKPLNPQLVFRELSPLLPDDALIAVDVGSVTYWYARYLRLRPGMDAHLSSTLASMGCAVPYGLAARLAMPERPLLILTGDGAMQMLGLAELVTLADRRGSLGDAPLMILVLHNHDLNEVTWEMRETEGDPRFWPSQRLPEFPYAEYAQLLGLHGIKIDAPDQVREALDEALKSGTPTLVEAVVDPAVPLMPPRVEPPQEQHVVQAFEHEGSSGSRARRHWSREMAQQQPSKDPAPPDPQRGAVHVHLAEPAPATPSSKPDAPA